MSLSHVHRWRVLMWLFLAIATVGTFTGYQIWTVAGLVLSAVYGIGSGLLEVLLDIRLHQLGESYRERHR